MSKFSQVFCSRKNGHRIAEAVDLYAAQKTSAFEDKRAAGEVPGGKRKVSQDVNARRWLSMSQNLKVDTCAATGALPRGYFCDLKLAQKRLSFGVSMLKHPSCQI
jgi:hypothetical protein